MKPCQYHGLKCQLSMRLAIGQASANESFLPTNQAGGGTRTRPKAIKLVVTDCILSTDHTHLANCLNLTPWLLQNIVASTLPKARIIYLGIDAAATIAWV